MEYRQEPEVQNLLKDLIATKARISKLLTQARQGLVTIQDAKVEVARQAKELEEQKEKILKLDQWLETINGGLKESTQQTEVTEEDIIRYIEIYERYIREYEEYEIILKSITVISDDESSQSLRVKLVAMQKALQETRRLVIIEIERLRQVLLHMRSAPEVAEDDISQTDRTIDSTSMPEEVVSPRETEFIEVKVPEKVPSIREVSEKVQESEKVTIVQESKPTQEKPQQEVVKVLEVKPTVTIDTQTGKSLMSEPPSVADKSVICQPEMITTHDVAISCAPPLEVEVQTSEPQSEEKELLETIQVRQTISDGHETIEIASRPVVREQKMGEQSLYVDANYRDDNIRKDSQLNITHSLPQSFETVMVEPDETTTEVVVDADGTKRIIVRKVRKTLVTRQQTLQTQQQSSHILSREGQEHSFSQITLKEDKGSTSTALEDGGVEHVQYQTYGGQVVSSLPGSEVTVQEFTSRPDLVIQMEKGMKPEQILQLAEGELPTQIQTSSSSVTAVVQQVTKRIVRTRRRIIRRVVIIDGKEHVSEEIVEEPDNVEVFEEQIPRVSIKVREQGGVQFEEIDDPSDKGDQPPTLPPGTGKDDVSKRDGKAPKDDKFPKDVKPDKKDVSKEEGSKSPSDKVAKEQELQRLMEDFMKKESEHGTRTNVTKTETTVRTSQERENTPNQTRVTKTETVVRSSREEEESPIQTVTFSEFDEVLPPDDTAQFVQEYLVQEPQGVQEQELQKMMDEFIAKEGEHGSQTSITRKETVVRTSEEKEGTPIQTVSFSESHEVLPSDDTAQTVREYFVQEPHEGQTTLTTHGVQHSTFETTSSNMSTIVQKVTRKITRTRKRIIRHIQIIDGKEHVTEEVIDEPDDVEIIEEDPKVTHNVQTEGVRTKRIKIIKQVQIIDGKEHVTEQIVEEPDDEFVPDSTVTAEINVQISKADVPSHDRQEVRGDIPSQITRQQLIYEPSQKDTSVLEFTKTLIGSEIDHSSVSFTPTKKPSVKKSPTEGKFEDVQQPKPVKETEKPEQVPEEHGLINIVRKIINEPDVICTSTVTKEVQPIKTENITTTAVTKTSDIKKLPIHVSEKIKELTSPVQEIITTVEKDVKPDSGFVTSTTTKEIMTTESKVKQPIIYKESITTSEVTTTIPHTDITIEQTSGVTKPEEILQLVQETVQSTEPQITISTVTSKQEVPQVTEFVGYDPNVTRESTVIDVTKTLIGSEVDHAITSQATKEPVDDKKGKLNDRLNEENVYETISTTNVVAEKQPEMVSQTTTETIGPLVSEITVLSTKESPVEFVQDKPSQVKKTVVTAITTTVKPQAERDTILTDITKSLISSEMDHSATSKIPAQPVTKKDDTRPKKVPKDTSQSKVSTATDTGKKAVQTPAKDIVTITSAQTITTTEKAATTQFEQDKQPLTLVKATEEEIFEPKVEITSITSKVQPSDNVSPKDKKKRKRDAKSSKTVEKDSSLLDITKSLIGSEMDHTSVSKIPASPVKLTGPADVDRPLKDSEVDDSVTSEISAQPVIKKDMSITEKVEEATQKDDSHLKKDHKEDTLQNKVPTEKPNKDTATITSSLTTVTTTEKDVKTQFEQDKQPLTLLKATEEEIFEPKVAITTITSKDQPSDNVSPKDKKKRKRDAKSSKTVEKVSSLLDITKGLIGSEMDHTSVSKIPASPVKSTGPAEVDRPLKDSEVDDSVTSEILAQPVTKKDMPITEKVEEASQKDDSHLKEIGKEDTLQSKVPTEKPDKNTVTIISSLTTVTTTEKDVMTQLEQDKQPMTLVKATEEEIFEPKVEITTITSKDQPSDNVSPKEKKKRKRGTKSSKTEEKDSSLLDITKSLIGSEMDHTSISKISASPVKTLEPAKVEGAQKDEVIPTKVTRKITRIRKRIIKHIQIIDGKEHVTEEVIEEPDDVEIIEEEPKITHNIQTEGVRTKRIKIIKQVQIIDGKEHVKEQIIEEPDDEFVPDSTMTAEINLQISKTDIPSYDRQKLEKDDDISTPEVSQLPVRKLPEPETLPTKLSSKEIITKIEESTTALPGTLDDIKEALLEQTKMFEKPVKVENKEETPTPDIKPDKLDHALKQTTIQEEKAQINVLELTKELLEKESIHVGYINEPLKPTDKPADVKPTAREIEKNTHKDKLEPLKITIVTGKQPEDPVHLPEKPTSKNLPKEAEDVAPIVQETVDKIEETVSLPGQPEKLLESKRKTPDKTFESVKVSPIQKEIFDTTNVSKDVLLQTAITETRSQKDVIDFTKDLIVQEGFQAQIPENTPHDVSIGKVTTEKILSQIKTEKAPAQSSVEVKPLKIGTVVTETDTIVASEAPELSYIRQFEPKIQGSSDSVNKLLATFGQPEQKEIPTQTSPPVEATASQTGTIKPDTKYDVTLLLDAERKDTHMRGFKPDTLVPESEKPRQTIDISMSLTKTDVIKMTEPKLKVDLKVEGFETKEPSIVKKDIDVNLPSEITIIREEIKVPVADVVQKDQALTDISPEKSVKDHKQSKKKRKNKRSSESSEPTPVETQPDTDKSIADTDSSSLSHYVELPTSPTVESPKPTEEALEPTVEIIQEADQDSSIIESEPITELTEEKGYEPEDVSLAPVPTPDKKKKQRRRKQHGVSEDTTYPKLSTTESDDTYVSSPVEVVEPICVKKDKKDKKRKKKTLDAPEVEQKQELTPEVKPESPKIGSEVMVTSPKDESYRTISDTSDIDTVKIVEECIQSSPETVKSEVQTTITFTVPVVEEIAVQEGSIQTSPEPVEPVEELPRPETLDTELQTSPTLVSEATIQTTPVEDKEAHTQTVEEATIVEKVERSDTEMQTSRTETPEKIEQFEVMTQVVPHDISTPEEKFSQTTPPVDEPAEVKEEVPEKPEIVTEAREMQTSPVPEVNRDEKSTEITVETTETDIQTVQQEQVDQETSTTPVKEKQVSEISIQTPEVPLVSTFTQSDEPEPVVEEIKESVEKPEVPLLDLTKKEVISVDITQQTSPRVELEEAPVPKLDLTKEIITVDSIQQTTPREPEVVPVLEIEKSVLLIEDTKKETITTDNTQQTTPREPEVVPVLDFDQFRTDIITTDSTQQTSPRMPSRGPTPVPTLDLEKREIITIDSTQQTSPRVYSEDSISTSTEEPYEVHLRAQITIPESTTDFLENERQFQEPPQSIVGERQKQRKRKSKKKAESPLVQSPESLSDPINSELSESVTPTSDDFSSRDPSSVDEGISQLASPQMPRQQVIYQPKLTYSDVVQRSKSKSPSPTKSFMPQKSEKARLLDALEKRTQSVIEPQKNIPDDSMAVALLEPSVEKSYDLVIHKELDEVKNAVEGKDSIKTERSVIIVIETISIWLEEIQYKIQRETVSGIKPTLVVERLNSLQNYVKNLKEIIEVVEVNEEIITLIETLTRQVDAVNTLRKQSPLKVKEVEKEWEKFQEDIDKLAHSVERVKSNLDNVIMSEAPTQQKLDKLDNIDSDNVDNFDTVTKMFKRYRVLLEANPKRECPSKLYSCEDDTKQVENTINTERDRLLQLTSLAEEYEQTLQDFGQITDVAEALLDGKIIVSDLDHLHEEIQKHRTFFVNLSHCRAILESLEDNLDSETKAKYAPLHNSLHDRATVIIDRAASRAQQMTLAASRWKLLEQGMKEEQQWLIVAQQRIPDLTNVTSRDHEQYINLYQSISLDVSHHYAKLLRLLSITVNLQHLIVCSGLDSECSTALDMLLKLQEDVDSRLMRLTAFKENWVTYDHLIDRIEGWMKIANRELEFITTENITTTGNLRRFWELKAQHEVYNNLKNESGVQFERALEILPISDEMVQRQFFSKVEDKWRDLANKIGDIHTSAIQNISDRDVTSGEKLNILEEEMRELRAALDGLKGVIKSEDELNLYIERLQVMTGRIDRIQNELGRLSLLPTAESERVGALLTQSGILDDQISEEMERSLLLKEKIVQVQAGIVRCQKSQRKARLTIEECESAERLGSDVVERASETCERLIEDLASQWRDILGLRQALHTLPTSLRVVVSPTGVERDISALQETHADLEAACGDLSARLRAKLQLWRRFERQLDLVQGAVREADYMVELLTVQGQVDYDRLLKATEKLETLSESLTRRSGELVGELRDAAAPLEASTEPAVAAVLRRELDAAAVQYEHTCTNLTQLCDKYHKAVEVWKRYRDAAAAVRAFAEFQEGRLHALRPDDAPTTAQACLEQEARVAELRSLAARVAAETGSRALQADADALARRLQLVAGAVQALADLGEARQLARTKAHHAKEMLCDMRQDLTPVQEDGEIVEDKLIALRDNLIALGKSEADIAPAKAELPDIDRDVSDEHSIVRILELWQAMFRDTFLHYHRLSTALVRSGDAATALRLWHEYLIDLQSFLSGSVPADYENLTEHRRLCRVHKNLLTSQRSVLMNENRDTKNKDLADRFDTLTNLHNETLARIVERHDEVCTRIASWDDYREVYTELLRWLKEMEREKEKLQLRYVHIKRIHKILAKIQNLADKVPEGKKQADKLLFNLKKVLEFTEQAYGAQVRMEYAGIVKRVDNLHASLDTWRDFLTRILGLIGEYEKMTNDLHKLYSKTQDEIMNYSDEDRLSRPQLKKTIDKYTDLRTKIEKTETQIETLSVIQEQLKECLSPQDIRIVNQRVWQLRQQRADLEHQLSIIIHRLQERFEVYTIFDTRLSRFAEWITTAESRLETSSQSEIALDPQDLIRRITSDVQTETAMKEREFEWISQTGNSLVEISKKDEKSYSKNTSKQLKEVLERWHKLQETGRSRITKINELLITITTLEERLTEIRIKLHTIESKLSTSIVLEHLTTKAVDEKFRDRENIHKSIESESGEVGETLNLCDLVFNDSDISKGNFDLRNLRTGVDIVEKKWKNICDLSEHRKNSLKEIRKSAELTTSLLPKVEKKLDGIEKRVEKIETRKQRGDAEDESVSKAVVKDLEALEGDVKKLEDAYSRIASARGVEFRGAGADDAARLRGAIRRWQLLRGRVDAAGADQYRQFVAAHGRAVVALAETDVRLTRALHLAPTPLDKEATLKELDGVEQELLECQTLVDEADRLSAAVLTAAGVCDMVAEYRALYADVSTRLDLARAEVIGDVDSAVQVDTLKWVTDASLQVDTLTSKETYRAELITAVKETSEALEALRNALLQQPKDDANSEELANAAKEIAKAGAKPAQTLELAKHLSELLLTECDANEDEALMKEVEHLSMRYEDLLAQAKKRELQINNLRLPHSASYALTCEHETGRLTCPLCSERNWKQLDNDLWRLEQWLQFAEATNAARTDPPEQYDLLEDAIQDHREFLLDLDSHKSIVVSLNVVGNHVAAHARSTADAERVRARLAADNQRWDDACAKAGVWQKRLQRALVHNQQFHDIVVELVAQLGRAERGVRSREPLRLTRPADELQRDFRRFSELRDELRRAEPRVLALHDAAQLLRHSDAPSSAHDICRRLGELRLRLQSLRKLSGVYALKLGGALARQPARASALAAVAASAAPQLNEEDEEQLSAINLPPLDENDVVVSDESDEQVLSRLQRGLRFVSRVARASLPFQALLLLLLGAAALAPHAHSDCRAPGLALEPVLRYPEGPPPL